MNIRDIITEAERDPSKDYSKLDQEFRNRTKPRIDSVGKPDSFDFPGAPKIAGEPVAPKAKRGGNLGFNISELSPECQKLTNLFVKKVTERGFTPVLTKNNYGYNLTAKTGNGIEVSLQMGIGKKLPTRLLVVLPNTKDSGEARENLLDTFRGMFKLPDEMFTVKDKEHWMDGSKPSIRLNDLGITSIQSIVDTFCKTMGEIQQMGPELKSSSYGRGARSEMNKSTNPADYYWKLANGLVTTYASGQSWALSRGGSESSVGGFDANDPVITVGYTADGYKMHNGGKSPYREHAVPCDLINTIGINMCKSMNVPVVKNGRVTDEGRKIMRKATHMIMNMIQKNLVIVLCSTEEAGILDNFNGWQTKMPDGWKDGDSPFARFSKAKLPKEYIKSHKLKNSVGIPVYSIKDLERVAEAQ